MEWYSLQKFNVCSECGYEIKEENRTLDNSDSEYKHERCVKN